jgi:hypothetical protein
MSNFFTAVLPLFGSDDKAAASPVGEAAAVVVLGV